jgi:hypothetical protein
MQLPTAEQIGSHAFTVNQRSLSPGGLHVAKSSPSLPEAKYHRSNTSVLSYCKQRLSRRTVSLILGCLVQPEFTTSHSMRYPWLSHVVQLSHVNGLRSQYLHLCATICTLYTPPNRSGTPAVDVSVQATETRASPPQITTIIALLRRRIHE